MAVMILAGITFMPAQKAQAADNSQEVTLSVNNQWSKTYTNIQETTFYKFVVPSDGILRWQVFNDASSKSLYLYSYILDYNMKSLASTYAQRGNASNYSAVLSAGTYYLRINGTSGDQYKIRLNHESYNTNDQKTNSNYSTAQTITTGQKIIGAFTLTDRCDWFKVKIPKSGTYNLSFIAWGYMDAFLYDDSLATNYGSIRLTASESQNRQDTRTFQLKAGTYYIKINPINSSDTGKYEFTFTTKGCSHTYKTQKVNATYFSKGYTKYTCTKCGKVVKKSYVAKLTIPKGTIKTLQAGTKKLTLSWKTISNVTGYQIRYSTDKNFKKNVKTTTVTGKSTSKKTISKLTSKKTYYVQVRAYAKKSGTTVYGTWSTAKHIKVK